MPSGKVSSSTAYWWNGNDTEEAIDVVFDDKYYNPGRSIIAKIVSVDHGGTVVMPDTATVTIIDDEQPPKVSINDILVTEGDPQPNALVTNAQFTVELTSALPQAVTVIPVVVHDISAKAGTDYLVATSAVVFGDGVLSTTFPVQIIRDKEPEADEMFSVELVPPAPITTAKAIGTCTIIDDDNAISPLQLRMPKGGHGTINIRMVNPVAVPEQVTMLASDPKVVTVPPVVTIPTGATGADVDVVGLAAGTGSILATVGPSRGSRTTEVNFIVYEPTTVTADPELVNVTFGSSGNVIARIDPVSPTPVTLTLTPAKSGIVNVPATVIVGTDGTVVIPVRAVGAGLVTVNINLPATNGGGSSSFFVNVTLPTGLVITGMSQAAGLAAGGDLVTIFGANFNGICVPTFGGNVVPGITSQQAGSIVVRTPPHDAGMVDVGIRCGTSSFVATNAFTYNPTQLRLTAVSPASGTTHGGTIVKISGLYLHTDSCSARFGPTDVAPIATNGTSDITVVTPPHAAGSTPVSLICGNETFTLAGGYNYLAQDDPIAVVFTYYEGEFRAGERDSIQATLFRADDVLLINGVPAADLTTPAFNFHSFTTPETPGPAEVTLRDYAARTVTRTVTIYPANKPTIAALSSTITLGAEFNVTGTGFRRGLTYMLGPAQLQPIAITNTSVVFRAPISVGPGTTPFSISDHGSTIVAQTADLAISGLGVNTVSPQCADMAGGSLVTISGSGFADGAAVQFGRVYSADVVVKDPFTLIARLPPPFGNAEPVITVFNPDGTSATLTNAFVYKQASDGGCGGGGGRRHAAQHG